MKVKDCKSCHHCQRRVWSQYYVPKDFHPIGMSHAYAYCAAYQKRVSAVKGCDRREGKENGSGAEQGND